MIGPGLPGEQENQAVLEAALRYAAAGVYVFPVRISVRGDNKKNVRPINAWKTASTTDPEIIRSWFATGEGAWRGAALAIDCGKSGIIGIDQDVSDGKNGPTLWDELREMWAPAVLTPSGGRHEYYRADPAHPITVDNSGTVANGVDIRGLGGFLFAPPSVDPRGGRWAWKEGEPDWEALPSLPLVVVHRMAAKDNDKRPKALTPVNENRAAASYVDALERDQLFDRPARGSFGPDGGYKTIRDAGELLDRRLKEFIELTESGSSRSHILAQDLGVLAGHGIPSFWSYDFARSALLNACEVNGFIGEHGLTYAMQQTTRGLDYGMTEPWHVQAADVRDVIPEPDAIDLLLAEMLKPSEVIKRPAPKPLIRGLLNLDSESWIIGAPGSKKSFVALDIAGHVAKGLEWQGLAVTQARVVMIVAEGAGGLGPRLQAWEGTYGPMGDDVDILPRPVQAASMKDWAVLVAACARLQPGLVVLDTQARVTVGLEENSAKEMGVFIEAVRAIREVTGACVLTVHHTGRAGGDARGSSAIDGAQSTELKVLCEKGSLAGKLVSEKQKDMALAEDMPLHFRIETVGTDEAGYPITSLVLLAGNAFVDASGQEEPQRWEVEGRSVRLLIATALSDHGFARGLTKAEARGVVVERFFGNVPGRLNKSTWYTAWNRAIEDELIVNVGGERFSADPVVIEAAREEAKE